MKLTGPEIQRRIQEGQIGINPFNPKQLGPNSYNLRLHNELLQYTGIQLDMKKDNPTKRIIIPESGLLIKPGEFYLGRTMETTGVKGGLVPMLEGRSSIGRLGIAIHVTAGFGDTHFGEVDGDVNPGVPWTLEIFALMPVWIYPGVEICQIYYDSTIGEIKPYQGKYQGNHDVQASMLYKDFEK